MSVIEEDSSIFDIRELEESDNSLYVTVRKDYILGLNNTIKELQRILKIRLRVESSEETNELLKVLQSNLDTILGIHSRLEKEIIAINKQKKINEENSLVKKKYEDLLDMFNQANEVFKTRNEEMTNKINKLRKDFEDLSFRNHSIILENEKLNSKVKEFGAKVDSDKKKIEEQENLITKLESEKESLKKQNLQINGLTKKLQENLAAKTHQKFEEKEKILEKISFLNEEFEKVKDNLNQKILERDVIISNLERKNRLLENEKKLNEDLEAIEGEEAMYKLKSKKSTASNEKKPKNKSKPSQGSPDNQKKSPEFKKLSQENMRNSEEK